MRLLCKLKQRSHCSRQRTRRLPDRATAAGRAKSLHTITSGQVKSSVEAKGVAHRDFFMTLLAIKRAYTASEPFLEKHKEEYYSEDEWEYEEKDFG